MNPRKLERVAAAICKAAALTVQPVCVTCENGKCTMVPQFLKEAEAALKAAKGF